MSEAALESEVVSTQSVSELKAIGSRCSAAMATMALQFALNRLFVVTTNLGSVFENVSVNINFLIKFNRKIWVICSCSVGVCCVIVLSKQKQLSFG